MEEFNRPAPTQPPKELQPTGLQTPLSKQSDIRIVGGLFAISLLGFIIPPLFYFWFLAVLVGGIMIVFYFLIGLIDLVQGKGGDRFGRSFMLLGIFVLIGTGSCAFNLIVGASLFDAHF